MIPKIAGSNVVTRAARHSFNATVSIGARSTGRPNITDEMAKGGTDGHG